MSHGGFRRCLHRFHGVFRRCLHLFLCRLCSVDGSDGRVSGSLASLSPCHHHHSHLYYLIFEKTLLVDNNPWIVLDCMQRVGSWKKSQIYCVVECETNLDVMGTC